MNLGWDLPRDTVLARCKELLVRVGAPAPDDLTAPFVFGGIASIRFPTVAVGRQVANAINELQHGYSDVPVRPNKTRALVSMQQATLKEERANRPGRAFYRIWGYMEGWLQSNPNAVGRLQCCKVSGRVYWDKTVILKRNGMEVLWPEKEDERAAPALLYDVDI